MIIQHFRSFLKHLDSDPDSEYGSCSETLMDMSEILQSFSRIVTKKNLEMSIAFNFVVALKSSSIYCRVFLFYRCKV